MKCPKCGYLGFESTDRCRNCGYDFSLSAPPADPELSLRDESAADPRLADFDLVAPKPQSPPALDLDRLFGADPAPPTGSAAASDDRFARSPRRAVRRTPPEFSDIDAAAASAPSALPFDDVPLAAPPRPARQPLGVRRTTPDTPRARPRTTRPVRIDDPPLDPDVDGANALEGAAADPGAHASVAPVGIRVAAGACDVGLLTAIGFTVLVLTLRVAGLPLSADGLRVVPPIPFAGFLLVVWIAYQATFTVAGGQTIGKMLMKVRVMGDDGRAVDLPGSILRAVGGLLVPLTLGLTYLPALLGPDRRAVHDRVAGTRVVSA